MLSIFWKGLSLCSIHKTRYSTVFSVRSIEKVIILVWVFSNIFLITVTLHATRDMVATKESTKWILESERKPTSIYELVGSKIKYKNNGRLV